MKDIVATLIDQALTTLRSTAEWPEDLQPSIQLERCKDKAHGDLACNVAMMLAKPLRSNPRAIAQQIVDALPASDDVVKVEIAGPGFINFFMDEAANFKVIRDILSQGEHYGRCAP